MREAIWFTAGGAGGGSKQLEYPQITIGHDGAQYSITTKFKNGEITINAPSIPKGLRQLADIIEKGEDINKQPGTLIIDY